MVHVYTTFTSDSALSLFSPFSLPPPPPPFLLLLLFLLFLFYLLPFLFFWFGVGWFGLNCFWVETVTKACSSSFNGSEPLPRLKRFKEVICRVSGVRNYGCGFAKSAGCVDWLNRGKFAASALWGCLDNPFKHVLVVNTSTSKPQWCRMLAHFQWLPDSNWVRIVLLTLNFLQVKLRMQYYVLCRSCECWIIIVLNYFWNYLILKSNPSLSTGSWNSSGSLRKGPLICAEKILGVEMRTPNDLVYGETNRYPLFVNSAVRCIRYWLKLTRMEASKLPGKAYNLWCYIY